MTANATVQNDVYDSLMAGFMIAIMFKKKLIPKIVHKKLNKYFFFTENCALCETKYESINNHLSSCSKQTDISSS